MMNTIPTADLLEASYRSDDFPQDWDRERRTRSLGRYVKWLQLIAQHPGARMAPTRDIDLFWHLHMLSPVAYYRDCMRIFGKVLDHDGGFGKGQGELPQLQEVFLRTARSWEAAFGEPYAEDGCSSSDAEATNCWHDCSNRCWHACSS